jgi:hypothetical protein
MPWKNSKQLKKARGSAALIEFLLLLALEIRHLISTEVGNLVEN